MKTYSEAFDVVPNDLDDLNHVNNIRYVEWIQEISKRHWNLYASTTYCACGIGRTLKSWTTCFLLPRSPRQCSD